MKNDLLYFPKGYLYIAHDISIRSAIIQKPIMNTISLLDKLEEYRLKLNFDSIDPDRKTILAALVDYIQSKRDQIEVIHLNFICTHNSRRSQFAQIWSQTAAYYYGIPAYCYSGGTEATAFSTSAVEAIKRAGFLVDKSGDSNPNYSVHFAHNQAPIKAFSKVFDDPKNTQTNFAAIMTCAHADKNCPFIPGTVRIPVRYDDPKTFDGTQQEEAKYDERSMQIATEMFYVFSKIN